MKGLLNMKGNKDWKLITIAVMALLLIGTGSWVGYTFYNAKQQNFAFQNQQLGRLAEQRNVINSIQATGFYSLSVLDQENNQRNIILAPVVPQQQAQQAQTQ
jgi:hypothetical protein